MEQKKQFGVMIFLLTKKEFKKLSIYIVNYDTLKCIQGATLKIPVLFFQ